MKTISLRINALRIIFKKTDKIDEQIALNRIKTEENSLFIADLQKLLYGGTGFHNSRYFSEYQLYRQKNNEQQIMLDQLKREFELDKELYGKKVIAKVEFEQKNNIPLLLQFLVLLLTTRE